MVWKWICRLLLVLLPEPSSSTGLSLTQAGQIRTCDESVPQETYACRAAGTILVGRSPFSYSGCALPLRNQFQLPYCQLCLYQVRSGLDLISHVTCCARRKGADSRTFVPGAVRFVSTVTKSARITIPFSTNVPAHGWCCTSSRSNLRRPKVGY